LIFENLKGTDGTESLQNSVWTAEFTNFRNSAIDFIAAFKQLT